VAEDPRVARALAGRLRGASEIPARLAPVRLRKVREEHIDDPAEVAAELVDAFDVTGEQLA